MQNQWKREAAARATTGGGSGRGTTAMETLARCYDVEQQLWDNGRRLELAGEGASGQANQRSSMRASSCGRVTTVTAPANGDGCDERASKGRRAGCRMVQLLSLSLSS